MSELVHLSHSHDGSSFVISDGPTSKRGSISGMDGAGMVNGAAPSDVIASVVAVIIKQNKRITMTDVIPFGFRFCGKVASVEYM